MKKADVQINHSYTARLDGQMAIVQILAANRNGGWDAEDLITGQIVHIRSVRQLRYAIHNNE